MEPPDFEQRARALLLLFPDDPFLATHNVPAIVENFRPVWNARGAADIAIVQGVVKSVDRKGSVLGIEPGIRDLDR
jgi:hypothetical protein